MIKKNAEIMDWSVFSGSNPAVMLSPMSGYTDSPYRRIVKEVNPNVIGFTELLSADGIHFGGERTRKMMRHDPIEKPLIIQLFGNDVNYFVEAALASIEEGASGIDINMGCPARKVVNSGHGSNLLRMPDQAFAIVKAVSEVIAPYPVSVKTRLGWVDNRELCAFVEGLIEAGAKAITLHGRTVKQMYQGEADWLPIFRVKHHVSRVMGRDDIPVFGNGDVMHIDQGMQKISADWWIDQQKLTDLDWRGAEYPAQVSVGTSYTEGGVLPVERHLDSSEVLEEIESLRGLSLDGFMIGRASFGNPWAFAPGISYEAYVPQGENPQPKKETSAADGGCEAGSEAASMWKQSSGKGVSSSEVIATVRRHSEYMIDYFGEDTGLKMMRKILPHYFSGFPGARDVRGRLIRVSCIADLEAILLDLQ